MSGADGGTFFAKVCFMSLFYIKIVKLYAVFSCILCYERIYYIKFKAIYSKIVLGYDYI